MLRFLIQHDLYFGALDCHGKSVPSYELRIWVLTVKTTLALNKRQPICMLRMLIGMSTHVSQLSKYDRRLSEKRKGRGATRARTWVLGR